MRTSKYENVTDTRDISIFSSSNSMFERKRGEGGKAVASLIPPMQTSQRK